nr:putative ribonuclease H-like domain-containing protein [Tanacetum cinerariifolium]
YASFMGFMVYQMDVKSPFLYGAIKEEVYVCQTLGFKDPDHLNKVYKVVKALYGLHQAPRAWFQPSDGYHVVPPLYTGTFMPPKPDLIFNTAPITVETNHSAFTVQLSLTKPAQDLSHKNRPTAPIIKDWVSDSEDESNTKAPQIVLSFVQPVSTVMPKFRVTQPRHAKPSVTKFKSPIRRHLTRSHSPKTSNSPLRVTAVKALVGNSQHALKDNGVIDSGCLRHMTGNMSYLYDFEELNGGYVAFGGNPKGGKISGKGKIKTTTKDETSPILKTFITGLENQLSLKQNGIAERKNMTLIEAARTMLADSLLPIPFWAEENLKGKLMKDFWLDILLIVKPLEYLTVEPYCSRDLAFTAGNQTNPSAGFQDKFNAEKAGEEIDQQYMLFPVWSSGSTNPQNNDGDAAFNGKEHDFDAKKPESEVSVSPSSSAHLRKQDDKTKKEAKGKSLVESFIGYRDLSAKFEDYSNNSINKVNAASIIVSIVGQNSPNNTNTFSAAELEDITYSDDEDDVGAEADFNNLETSITFSPIPTTRVHKDHHVSQIIGDLPSTTQTRSMTKVVKDQGRLSQMFNDEFHTCMFSCFLSQEEPKRVHQGLKDPSWIEAMQNKKDERGIVIRNKARLVAQGHTQEEGIDYEEVFAPVARIEAIRLFLAYASFMGFMVYQMDVKSAFLYETIEEEVYVCQPPRFEDPNHPDKVYKVVKAIYGLHQAPRAWYETLANYLLENGLQRGKIDQTLFIKRQKGDILLVQIYIDDIIFGATNKDLCKSFEKLTKDKFQTSSMGELTFFLGLQVKQNNDGIFISQDKYVAEILRKFRLTKGKSASTPIDTEKPLLKDPDGEDVDVHTYRSMISSLMYLTSSRPDIMFAVCACARFQVTPKVSHLHAVKRIFRYLKGKTHLGLWYPNDSPFDLVAYSDSDYAGASLDRKSTTGGCQFLGCKLISWQCKKQTVIATSSTVAEYVAAASCYTQVLWIQNQLLDYGD